MARKQTPKPSKAAPAPRTDTSATSADEVRQLIEQTAYYKAKERGFAPGHELDDRIAAETEVRRRLAG